MTTTLSVTGNSEALTSTPLQVLGLQTTWAGNNIFHKTLAGGMDITLVQADLRSGTLEFLFATEDDAANCVILHVYGSTVTMSDDERTLANITYVVNGNVGLTLDDETRDLWKVSVDFQEVQPS